MQSIHPFRFTLSCLVLGAFLFSILAPDIAAANLQCQYDRGNPSLDHAVRNFMDPTLFECAEMELRDVLAATDPTDAQTMTNAHFLLAGALFGMQLSSDIPDSVITEHLIKGFLITPDWSGTWYFNDMPDFMNLVSPARDRAVGLLQCPYDSTNPSLEHARQVMQQYDLYGCAESEVATAMTMLEQADSAVTSAIAEAYFLMGETQFGRRLSGAEQIDDSLIVDNLARGFVHAWDYSGGWLFSDSPEFTELLSQARLRAEEIRQKDDRGFFDKPINVIGTVGAAVAGVVGAILIFGGDDSSPETGPDTIPSFPQPPGE